MVRSLLLCLVIEFVHEFKHCYWQALPSMVPDGEDRWMLPEAQRDQREQDSAPARSDLYV